MLLMVLLILLALLVLLTLPWRVVVVAPNLSLPQWLPQGLLQLQLCGLQPPQQLLAAHVRQVFG